MSRRRVLALALAGAGAMTHPLVPAWLTKTTLLVLVLVTALVARLREVTPTRALLLAAGLLGWLALGLGWGLVPEPTHLGPWLVLVLGLAVGSAFADAERCALVEEFAILLLLAEGGLVVVDLARRAPVTGGFGNGNALGLAAAPCLPFAVEGIARALGEASSLRERARSMWLQASAALAGGLVLAMSESRTAWVALGVVWASWLLRRGRGVRQWLVLFVGALVLVLRRGDALHALEGRLWIARSSLRAARSVWPLGAGPGGFASAYLDGQGALLAELSPNAAATTFVHAVTPHGDVLGLAVTGGLVGLVLGAGLAFALVSARAAAPFSAAMGALVVVAVAGLGDDALVLPSTAALVGLSTPSAPLASLRARRLGGALAAAALVASTWLLPRLIRRVASQHALHEAEHASLRIEDPRVLLTRARRLDPSDGEAALALGLAHLADGDATLALEELAVARRRLANVGTSIAIGNAELALGRAEPAVRAYRDALRIDPGSFRARANLVEALRVRKAFSEARTELAIARDLQPHHPKLSAIAERLQRAELDDAVR